MKKIIQLVITIGILLPSFLFSQDGRGLGILEGTIENEEGIPLPRINVMLESTSLGSATDEQGFFRIQDIPYGNYTLIASGVGFSAQKQDVTVEADKIVKLNLALNEATSQLSEVVVVAPSKYFNSENTTVLANRMPMKVFETPQQIQVIGRTLMDDQQVQNISEVFQNSSGVFSSNNYGGAIIRGFNVSQDNYLYNGQRGGLTAATIVPFLAHIERVEILKGASGVLFGEGGLGGTINMVTKKPTESTIAEISLAGGSFNTFRGTFDFGGSLVKNKKLMFRLSGGYEDAESFMDFFYNKSFVIAPALLYKISDRTEIEWNASYLYDDRNVSYQQGVPAINGDIFALPRSFTIQDPDDYGRNSNWQSQFGIKHRFSDRLVLNGLYNFGNSEWNTWSWGTANVEEDAGIIQRYRENYIDQRQPYHHVNIFANYAFEMGRTQHSFVLGYDHNQLYNTIPGSRTTFENTPLDAFNPQYGLLSNEEIDALLTFRYSYDIREKSDAAYLQYALKFDDKLNVLLGGRYQQYRSTNIETLEIGTPDERVNNNASDVNVFLPRVGLSYLIDKNFSVFAGYNQGFVPQASNGELQGGPFPAETGNQYEVGAKANLLDGKLNVALSLYNITKNNILTRDPNDDTGLRQVATGQVQSQGIELDIIGNLTPQWQIIANFAYNNIEVTESNVAEQTGQRFGNSIPVLANLWTTYKLNGALKGFKIGGGLNYSDKRLITIDPQLEAPAYTLLNATLGYEGKKFDVGVNINNITNVDYVIGTQTFWAFNINRGAPTNFLAIVRYRFK